MKFRDIFSGVADDYAAYRPQYPAVLFDWLASVSPRCDLAWDCACGSGQASLPLASRFALVAASDASALQVSTATETENIRFLVAAANPAPLADGAVDLVTVAQALHWFVGNEFFAEVRRVVRPGGVFAAWTYGLPHVDSDAVEKTLCHFIEDFLGPYWPPEIRLVLDGYASIELPFEEIETPEFEMRAEWTLKRFLAFVHTWSAVGRFVGQHGEDPVDRLAAEIESLWGGHKDQRPVSWRIDLRVGRI